MARTLEQLDEAVTTLEEGLSQDRTTELVKRMIILADAIYSFSVELDRLRELALSFDRYRRGEIQLRQVDEAFDLWRGVEIVQAAPRG